MITRSSSDSAPDAICYVVVDPVTDHSVDLRVRHSDPHKEFLTERSAGLIRIRHSAVDLDELADRDDAFDLPAYTQLRLAVDITADLCGYPRLLPCAAEANVGLVALTSTVGQFNHPATELLHLLGSDVNVAVHGSMVLHAVPNEDQLVPSLSDWQLLQLAEIMTCVNRNLVANGFAAAS